MVQSQIVQIDVAFLTYNPRRCVDTPSVKQDNPCLSSLADLYKHRESKRKEKETMGPEAYHHYKWYNSMLFRELREQSEDSKLRITHWHIESGNTEAFKMGGVLYRAVSIVIGPEMEHWYCANTGPSGSHSYGSRYRNNHMAQHEWNIKKVAKFTIDDDEALLVLTPTTGGLTKCSAEVCANNCMECKKHRSPFTKTNNISKCVCYPPSKDDFKSIDDSDLDMDSEDEDQDIVHSTKFFGKSGLLNPRFKLNAIREESFC